MCHRQGREAAACVLLRIRTCLTQAGFCSCPDTVVMGAYKYRASPRILSGRPGLRAPLRVARQLTHSIQALVTPRGTDQGESPGTSCCFQGPFQPQAGIRAHGLHPLQRGAKKTDPGSRRLRGKLGSKQTFQCSFKSFPLRVRFPEVPDKAPNSHWLSRGIRSLTQHGGPLKIPLSLGYVGLLSQQTQCSRHQSS